MKIFNYVLSTALMFSLLSCEKEAVVNNALTEKEYSETVNQNTYFSYNVNDIDEVIRLANENYIGNNNSGNRAKGPTFEINYSGRYFDLIDPNNPISGIGRCFLPENICGIIITAEKNINVQEDATVYVNSDIIKMYPDNPVRVSYDTITVIMGPTLDSPNALSTFIFK